MTEKNTKNEKEDRIGDGIEENKKEKPKKGKIYGDPVVELM